MTAREHLTVYASDGGLRYHARWSCPALVAGQLLSDYDCDEYCRHDHPSTHPALDYGIAEAVECGRTPCRVCVPPLGPSEDFGHEPVISFLDGRALAKVCARCRPAESGIVHAVRWPCTTAVVLGLDKEAAR